MPDSLTVGWVYNLHDPAATTTAPRLITIAIIFSVLATLAIALRFTVRLRSVAGLGLDDAAVLSSCVRNAPRSSSEALLRSF